MIRTSSSSDNHDTNERVVVMGVDGGTGRKGREVSGTGVSFTVGNIDNRPSITDPGQSLKW